MTMEPDSYEAKGLAIEEQASIETYKADLIRLNALIKS